MIRTKVAFSIVLASAMLAGCTSNASKETAVTETTDPTQIETMAASTEESTEASSTEAEPKEYVLTDEAKGELENVFMDCFYFQIGDHNEQLFTNLSTENVGELVCATFISPDSYLHKGSYVEGTGYEITREEFAEYLKDGFGLNLDDFDFSEDQYTTLEDSGDTFSWAGGDYGNGIPDAIINTAAQDPESGIITLTGDALFIDVDDSKVYPYVFTATMQPSDSKYFGGNTLVSFEYTENTTGVYPEINPEKYGLFADHHLEITEQ